MQSPTSFLHLSAGLVNSLPLNDFLALTVTAFESVFGLDLVVVFMIASRAASYQYVVRFGAI